MSGSGALRGGSAWRGRARVRSGCASRAWGGRSAAGARGPISAVILYRQKLNLVSGCAQEYLIKDLPVAICSARCGPPPQRSGCIGSRDMRIAEQMTPSMRNDRGPDVRSRPIPASTPRRSGIRR
jgi:hypothetical protein